MKPRQTIKNFHHTTPSSYQNQNSSANTTIRDIDLLKIGLNPDMVTLLQQAQNNNNNNNPSTSTGIVGNRGASLNNIMGSSTSTSSSNLSTNKEEIMKCLQAIYAKNGADILNNLPALSDWPMQSVSPPDYPKVGLTNASNNSITGGSKSAVTTNNATGIEGSSNLIGGNNSGTCFTNTNINNSAVGSCNSGQQKKDIQYNINNQQHSSSSSATSSSSHSQQISSTAISNHFRIPSSSSSSSSQSQSNTHSPQQHNLPHQQQKSVLSLHQHHQNDLTNNNRRLNHQLSSGSNASFTNLNAIANTSKLPNTSNLGTDSIQNNSTNNNTNLNASSGNITKNSSISNIMDAIGPGDSMFFDSSLPISKELPSANMQQSSLSRHQQLQNLLKAAGSSSGVSSGGNNSASSCSGNISTKLNKATTSPATLSSSHRNDTVLFQRNSLAMSSSNMAQHPITSQQTPTISPPHAAFPSVPKSLLNLAACSSTASNSASSSSSTSSSLVPKVSNLLGQINNSRATRSSHQNSATSNNATTITGLDSSVKPLTGRSNISGTNTSITETFHNSLKGPNNTMNDQHSNMIQQITRTANSSGNNSLTNINNYKVPSRHSKSSSSLLDDSANRSLNNPKSNNSNIINTSDLVSSSVSKPSSVISSNTNPRTQKTSSASSSSKETYIATLQERAAKAGISIGEIKASIQSLGQSNSTNYHGDCDLNYNILASNQANIIDLLSPTNQVRDDVNPIVDRREIESALHRVEARNDLSLLYPSVALGPNSQKQINALSAGLHNPNDSELFSPDVKRIVLEECNIIYECKVCSNLFRSLTNLVKHKTSFCPDLNSERLNNNIEETGRTSQLGNNQVIISSNNINNNDSNNIAFNNDVRKDPINQHLTLDSQKQNDLTDFESGFSSTLDYSGDSSSLLLDSLNHSDNLRGNQLERRQKMMNIAHNNDRKNFDQDGRSRRHNLNVNRANPSSVANISTAQTSLSKLLQSQPKNRLPVSRDSALIGALNMIPNSSMQIQSINNNNTNSTINNSSNNLAKALTALESDKIRPSEVAISEQLMQNSSLAKTLLNEKAIRQSVRQLKRQNESTGNCHFTPPQASSSSSHRSGPPKRKNLEDCIQKVKRDKRLPDEGGIDQSEQAQQNEFEGGDSQSKVLADTCADAQTSTTNQPENAKFSSPLESDDSDMLMIDLDEPRTRSNISSRRGRRRGSTTASSTASSSSSTMTKLNTSSALLKALTKPVGDKKLADTVTPQSALSQELNESPTLNQEQLTKSDDTNIYKEVIKDNTEDEEHDLMSPLFDSYSCDICGEDQRDLKTLTNHTVEQHRGEKMIYPCIFCSQSYITLENVCRHIIEIHKKSKDQVHRLKEVVRSRAKLSSDFSACNDYPSKEANNSSNAIETTNDDLERKNQPQHPSRLVPSQNDAIQTNDAETIRMDQSPASTSTKVDIEQIEDELDISVNDNSPTCGNRNDHDEQSSSNQPSVPDQHDMEQDDDIQVDREDQIIDDDDDLDDRSMVDEKLEVDDEEEDEEEEEMEDQSDDEEEVGSVLSVSEADYKNKPAGEESEDDSEGSAFTETRRRLSSHSADSSSPSSSSSSGSSGSSSSSSSSSSSDDSGGSDSDSSCSASSPESSPRHKSAANELQIAKPHELAPQVQSSPSATGGSNKVTEPSPSNASGSGASGASGGGGIMKLKITLKTKSDEKSKVYEIV